LVYELLIAVGIVVVLIGIFLIFSGFLFSMKKLGEMKELGERGNRSAETKGGGIIMIGPIPIIFGSDKTSLQTVIILTIVLMVVAFLLFWLIRKVL